MINTVVENALSKYIKWKIRKLNGNLDWERLGSDVGCSPDEEKSIVIHTKDKNSTYSFIYNNRALQWTDRVPLEATVTLRCSHKVFKAIITGQIGVDEAFYGNLVDLEGENLLREKIAANILFDAFFTDEGYEKYKHRDYSAKEILDE
mgnify:CR=1 FL=1